MVVLKNISVTRDRLGIVNSTTELICNDPKRRANEAESSENWQAAPELVEIFGN